MSEYLSVHNNEAAYFTASANLNTPHVAFLKNENQLRYTKYSSNVLANAKYGQILASTGTDVGSGTFSLFDTFTSDDYETYNPIAICILDRISSPVGKTVFMSISYMDYVGANWPFHEDGTTMYWGCYDTNVNAEVTDIRDNTITGELINTEAKQYITRTLDGNNVVNSTDAGKSAAFETCWNFAPYCPTQTWCLPSRLDFVKYRTSADLANIINNQLTSVYNVMGYSSGAYKDLWTCNESTKNYAYIQRFGTHSYDIGEQAKAKNSSYAVRAVFYV